MQNYNIQLP